MLFNALYPPPLLPHSSVLNAFFYAFSRFISALTSRTEAERNLNRTRLEAVFVMLYEKFDLVVHQRRSPLHPLNVQGGYLYLPEFADICKLGVLHILFQYTDMSR